MKKKAIFLFFMLSTVFTFGQSKLARKFNTSTMTFAGSKSDQAKYLLRPVKKYGHLGEILTNLPEFLDEILTNKRSIISKEKLKGYLLKNKINSNEIGGNLNEEISSTANGIKAGYFVIHDASNLIRNPISTEFPSYVNSLTWGPNKLSTWSDFKNAHIFINRLGQSITSKNLDSKVQATKFESKTYNPTINGRCLGSFLHIELIQPRTSDIGKKNDAIAIKPGFTQEQYKRLALIYIVASSKKGEWLVPAFHSVLDEGIKNAHDDPQNFELKDFSQNIELLFNEIIK